MDFAGIVWWQYAVAAAAALGFGLLQSWLIKRAAMVANPKRWLYAVKFALWAAALVTMALISLPLMVVFVAVASLTLLVGSAILYQKAQREAR